MRHRNLCFKVTSPPAVKIHSGTLSLSPHARLCWGEMPITHERQLDTHRFVVGQSAPGARSGNSANLFLMGVLPCESFDSVLVPEAEPLIGSAACIQPGRARLKQIAKIRNFISHPTMCGTDSFDLSDG